MSNSLPQGISYRKDFLRQDNSYRTQFYFPLAAARNFLTSLRQAETIIMPEEPQHHRSWAARMAGHGFHQRLRAAGWRHVDGPAPAGPWHASAVKSRVRSVVQHQALGELCALGRLRMDGWQQRGLFPREGRGVQRHHGHPV